jgi:murein DD-endopeptidase MepM/ murein hydrolase activator NlpD
MIRLAPPVPGGVICQLYKPEWNPTHAAIDFCAPVGTPILAIRPGVIVEISSTPHGGNNFIIRHDNGLHTYHAHCDTILVRVGQRVKALQQIATVGKTGSPNPGVTTIDPHLHLQVMAGQAFSTTHYNPLDYLAQNGIEAKDRVMCWKDGYPKRNWTKYAVGLGLSLAMLGGFVIVQRRG